MTDTPSPPPMTPADVLRAATATEAAVPVRMVTEATSAPQTSAEVAAGFGPAAAGWLGATRFTPAAKKQVMLPAADGQLAAVVLGGGNGRAGEPSGPSDLLVGQLSQSLPPGTYRLDTGFGDARLAAVAWGLGAYRFRRYKSADGDAPPVLAMADGADLVRSLNEVEAVWLGRDLINTPASDHRARRSSEAAARELASRHGATVSASSSATICWPAISR